MRVRFDEREIAELARQLAPVIADRVADGVGLLGLLEQYAPAAVGEIVEWRIEVRGVREVYQAMGLSPHVAASRLLAALRGVIKPVDEEGR